MMTRTLLPSRPTMGLGLALSIASVAVAPALAAQVPAGMQGQVKAIGETQNRLYAECTGLPLELVLDAFFETRGELRNPTKAEQKRKEEATKQVFKSVPKKQHEECMGQAVQQAMMGGMTGMMGQAAGGMPGGPGAGSVRTEAAGKDLELAEDLEAELTAGKTVIRHIDWVAYKAELSAGGADAFNEAMTVLGEALVKVGGAFRVDFYLDTRYDEESATLVARSRLQLMQMGLGEAAAQVELGTVKRDKNPRIEVVK